MMRCSLILLAMCNQSMAFMMAKPQLAFGSNTVLIAKAGRTNPGVDLIASAPNNGAGAKAAAVGYYMYAFGFAALLLKTLSLHPLIPPSPNSLAWCRAWLWTTVADYYGAALALCGVIIATEQRMLMKVLWSCGCLFLGTPFCCFWVAARLLKGGSLKLSA